MDNKIEILESGFVTPSEETPKHNIWLSNLDLLMVGAQSPTVYFYRPNSEPGFFSVDRLKSALADALVPYYPLAGRLGANDQTGRLEINCTGSGALFVVARSSLTVDDFGDFAPSNEMRKMLVPSPATEVEKSILLMFQVTFFRCGGVCLGTAVHHLVVDGHSALQFINTWCTLARGTFESDQIPRPFLDRTLLRARTPPVIQFDHTAEYPDPGHLPACNGFARPPLISSNLRISKGQIEYLKNQNKKLPLSTFRYIATHIWRCACRAFSLEPEQETKLMMSVSVLKRIKPHLPIGYLGNTIIHKYSKTTVSELLSSVEHGATKIDEAIADIDDKVVRSVIDYLELNDASAVRKRMDKEWATSRSKIWVNSWQSMPTYDADFGWGKPVYMGMASLSFGRLAIINHEPGEGGGIMVSVSLDPEIMGEFKRVFYEELGL